MLRIAFDIHSIGQNATGNETYAEGLLHAFQAARPADCEIHFYHTGARFADVDKEQFHRLRPAWPYVRIPLVTPFRLLLDRMDMAHFQYFAPPLSPCPTVLTVHDLSFERHPEFFDPIMTIRMRTIMPYMVRRARRLNAVSEATRADLVELYGVAPERVSVIHNGVSTEFTPMADTVRIARALGDVGIAGPYIMCVGNLGVRKNQRRLVRAYARLLREHDPCHDLVLVGKPSFGADEVMREIERLGLRGRVHVLGFVTREQLLCLYNQAIFTVYPSLFEGFGLPLVESMACGTPVITSTLSCMPEIAGGAALLVDPLDESALCTAMAHLLGSEEERRRLRGLGLARSRQFSWAASAALTLEVYRKAALQ